MFLMHYHTCMDWVTLSCLTITISCSLQFISSLTTKWTGHGIHARTTLTLGYNNNVVLLWREQTHLEKKLAEKENYQEGLNSQISNLSRMVCFVKIMAFYTVNRNCLDREYCVLNHWRFQIQVQNFKRSNQTGTVLFPSWDLEMNTISTVIIH